MALEDAAQRKRRIARRQYGGRHLVEQRLELLIVILIDQRDPNIRVRSQFTRTVQSGETATDYNDVLHRGFLSDRLDQPWKQGNLHGTSLVANPLHVLPEDDLLPSIVELWWSDCPRDRRCFALPRACHLPQESERVR